ncbi:hypothetical protein ET495_04285 [Xylanimonas allomyrinae]|uniref:Uncharacterized protein n=1 Tax=Xylanimonas allomyrinae TaxID=2509459 RepID=A0A4P6EJ27_9MICO|nr:hypothetical protein [Xylanimonas allomyrinae]QAY62600.1 hypothetical protein ET495_04285 [Xylanimonas allomyrinae]
MANLFDILVQAPPSGRRRALLIDSDAYARAVIRQGAPIPWGDLAAFTGFAGQVQALLGPDAGWVDVASLHAAHLARHPQLVAAMGERSRPGYALRTLLASAEATEEVLSHLSTIALQTQRPIVLACPSPGRWAAIAAAAAGTPLDVVDEDAADTASVYVAEWLGKLAGARVALVLSEGAGDTGGAVVAPESLASYTSIANVAAHLGWAVALRSAGEVETLGPASIGQIPSEYWAGGDPDIDGDVLLATLPADAVPERVLEQLARLN